MVRCGRRHLLGAVRAFLYLCTLRRRSRLLLRSQEGGEGGLARPGSPGGSQVRTPVDRRLYTNSSSSRLAAAPLAAAHASRAAAAARLPTRAAARARAEAHGPRSAPEGPAGLLPRTNPSQRAHELHLTPHAPPQKRKLDEAFNRWRAAGGGAAPAGAAGEATPSGRGVRARPRLSAAPSRPARLRRGCGARRRRGFSRRNPATPHAPVSPCPLAARASPPRAAAAARPPHAARPRRSRPAARPAAPGRAPPPPAAAAAAASARPPRRPPPAAATTARWAC